MKLVVILKFAASATQSELNPHCRVLQQVFERKDDPSGVLNCLSQSLGTLTSPANVDHPTEPTLHSQHLNHALRFPMDLFHAVTQSLPNVLTCDWYDSFKTFKMDDKSKSKTMDTERGGENTQYVQFHRSILCFVHRH